MTRKQLDETEGDPFGAFGLHGILNAMRAKKPSRHRHVVCVAKLSHQFEERCHNECLRSQNRIDAVSTGDNARGMYGHIPRLTAIEQCSDDLCGMDHGLQYSWYSFSERQVKDHFLRA